MLGMRENTRMTVTSVMRYLVLFPSGFISYTDISQKDGDHPSFIFIDNKKEIFEYETV